MVDVLERMPLSLLPMYQGDADAAVAERKADKIVDSRPPHKCHWIGCRMNVPPRLWGCRRHWFMLPSDLRGKIWRAYRPGQEIDKRPSAKYIAVAKEVQLWIMIYG